EVVHINAYSGHADMADLDNFVVSTEGIKKIILVHGELDEMNPFAQRIRHAKEGVEILMPEKEEEILI
ncbi:MBL fold metallo-hydrolase, partial [Patescibacteria group bacterium]|nr:MBL fold metallo-hydrolase [Patescibacteria group bacterium]